MKRVILLHGKARSGKDTFFDILKEENYDVEKVSFAAPMKEIASILFNCSLEELEEIKDKPHKIGCTPRRFLQLFGTDFIKELCHKDIWVNLAIETIERSKAKNIVITDCRFRNELKIIRELYKTLAVKIVRTDGVTTSSSSHCSEQGLEASLFDNVIENNMNRDDYKNKVLQIFNALLTEEK